MAQFGGGGGNKNPPWAPRGGGQNSGEVPPGLVGLAAQPVFQAGNPPGLPPGLAAGVGPLGVHGPPGGHGPAVTLAAVPVSSRTVSYFSLCRERRERSKHFDFLTRFLVLVLLHFSAINALDLGTPHTKRIFNTQLPSKLRPRRPRLGHFDLF